MFPMAPGLLLTFEAHLSLWGTLLSWKGTRSDLRSTAKRSLPMRLFEDSDGLRVRLCLNSDADETKKKRRKAVNSEVLPHSCR